MKLRKFSTKFSEGLVQRSKQEMIDPDYLSCIEKLGNFYEKKANDLQIRTKCKLV